MAKAGRGDDQYMLRFPPGLREAVKAAAEANGRSMNSEIIDRLEASFSVDPAPSSDEQSKLIEEQREALKKASNYIDQTMGELKSASEHLAYFARVIDSAAKGNTEMLEGIMEAARERPLPPDDEAPF